MWLNKRDWNTLIDLQPLVVCTTLLHLFHIGEISVIKFVQLVIPLAMYPVAHRHPLSVEICLFLCCMCSAQM